MNSKCIFFLIISILLFFLPQTNPVSYSWGFYGHQQINRMAVFTLPDGLIGFYKHHLNYISTHAVDPDKRRYTSPDEAPRHYIDLDHYGPYAVDSVPHHWKRALSKYSEDTLKAYGIVPWHIEKTLLRLTEAFRSENADLILHYSADLGHYIADAHVPLHTTENYNGQLTNQKGIHGFWESRIPELKATSYSYWLGRAHYISNINDVVWNIINTSHSEVDSVLSLEKQLNEQYPPDKKYSVESRGSLTMKVYSEEYANDYNQLLNGMVERRMRAAIITVASFWYTAWVNAGKPDLLQLANLAHTDSLKKADEEIELQWKSKNGETEDHGF